MTDNYFSNIKPIKNLEIVLPLFPEALQIFLRGSGKIVSSEDFLNLLNSREINQLAIDLPNSTTNRTVKYVLKLLGSRNEDVFNEKMKPSEFLESFNNSEIDGFAFLSAFPLSNLLLGDAIFDMVTFSNHDINIISDHLINLNEIQFNSNIYPSIIDSSKLKTVGTWAFLVSTSKKINSIQLYEKSSVAKTLLKGIYTSDLNNSYIINAYKENGYFKIKDSENLLQNSVNLKDYSLLFRGLPVNRDLKILLGMRDYKFIFTAIIIFIIIFTFLLTYKYRNILRLNLVWHSYKHFIFTGIFFIATYLLISMVTYQAEQSFFETYAVKSPVLNLTPIEFHKWLLLAVLADYYYSDLFPISTIGQIGVSITFYLFWIAGLFLITFEILHRTTKSKRRNGMKNINYQNHFVICGWNNRTPGFVTNTRDVLKNYIVHNSNHIVLINKVLKDNWSKFDDVELLHERKLIDYVYGDAKDTGVLASANVEHAKTVVLLADGNTTESDERTLLRALAITRHCRNMRKVSTDSIYIIAEINDPELKQTLYDADVNEVISTIEIGKNILTQSMINHGISQVLDTVLTYNQHNEFYMIDLREHKKFVGKTFDELIIQLREKDILLLGIKSRHFDSQGNEIIDRNELRRLDKEKFNIERSALINPHTQEEKNYSTDGDDALIVLATSERILENL